MEYMYGIGPSRIFLVKWACPLAIQTPTQVIIRTLFAKGHKFGKGSGGGGCCCCLMSDGSAINRS